MKISIREAKINDQEIFISLWSELSTFNYHSIKKTQETLTERLKRVKKRAIETLTNSINEGNPYIFIASHQGQDIGYAMVYHDEEKAILDHLFMKEQARGDGFGKELTYYVEGILKERGIKQLELKVFSWNEAAHRFYLKSEYEPYYTCLRKDLEKS